MQIKHCSSCGEYLQSYEQPSGNISNYCPHCKPRPREEKHEAKGLLVCPACKHSAFLTYKWDETKADANKLGFQCHACLQVWYIETVCRCGGCGTDLKSEWQFCPKCGEEKMPKLTGRTRAMLKE